MKILYLHGIGSGAEANTALQIAKHFQNDTVFAPELPVMPKDAFEFILKLQKVEQPNLVIGTSLGGFYARYLHGPIKILVNPAMSAEDVISAVGYGEHEFVKPRKSGEKTYVVDEAFVNQLREISDKHEAFIDDEMLSETFALFGTNDAIVSNYGLFKNTYREYQAKLIEAEHRLSDKNIEHDLIPLIEYLKKGCV